MNKSAFVLVLLLLVPPASQAQEGDWLVAPYLWAADASWDLAQRGSGGVAFSDLVDKIDGAALMRVEYARNKIGFTFDYVDIGLSDGRRFVAPGPTPIDVTVRAGVDVTVLAAGVFYRPSATDHGVDVIAGVRDIDVGSTLLVTQAGNPTERFGAGDSLTDIYVGARYLHRLSEAWDFSIRGDYGFGGSDGAVNVSAQVGWRSRGAFGMSLAYRHLAFDFDQRVDGEPASSDYTFSGPGLGFMFRF